MRLATGRDVAGCKGLILPAPRQNRAALRNIKPFKICIAQSSHTSTRGSGARTPLTPSRCFPNAPQDLSTRAAPPAFPEHHHKNTLSQVRTNTSPFPPARHHRSKPRHRGGDEPGRAPTRPRVPVSPPSGRRRPRRPSLSPRQGAAGGRGPGTARHGGGTARRTGARSGCLCRSRCPGPLARAAARHGRAPRRCGRHAGLSRPALPQAEPGRSRPSRAVPGRARRGSAGADYKGPALSAPEPGLPPPPPALPTPSSGRGEGHGVGGSL